MEAPAKAAQEAGATAWPAAHWIEYLGPAQG